MSFQTFITDIVKTLYEKFVMVVRHMKLQDEIASNLKRKNDINLAALQYQIDDLRKSLRSSTKSSYKSKIASTLNNRQRIKNQYRISFTESTKETSDNTSCYLDQSHGRVCVANNKLEMAQQDIIKLQIENRRERDQLHSVIASKTTELDDLNAKLEQSRQISAHLQQSYQTLGVQLKKLQVSIGVEETKL